MSQAINDKSQVERWSGQFGKDYTERNPHTAEDVCKLYIERYGITRVDMNNEFIGNFSRDIKILEAGSNVGTQLMTLQEMGFKNLYGVELQEFAVEMSKKFSKNINIIQGNILDIPFKDKYFDVTFTSGVLIHISPDNLPKVMNEIARCSKKYIFGFEYYSDKQEEIHYRGNRDLAWKCDFAKEYLKNVSGLKLIKEKRFKYLQDDNVDTMFLLEKTA